MNILILTGDVVCLCICIIAAYVAFKLWILLGKHGLVTWIVLAMVYAIFLRFTSIASDLKFDWGFINYSRILALPMYLFLLLGLWGLLQQVMKTLSGNGKKA